MAHPSEASIRRKLQTIDAALDSGALNNAKRLLNSGLNAPDIAHLLESSPPKQRDILWSLLNKDLQGETLNYLNEDILVEFLSGMDAQDLVEATEDYDTDDLVDILQQLPDTLTAEVLDAMDAQDRHRVEAVLLFDEDTAGGLMNTDAVTVRPEITVDVVLRYLRRHRSLPEMTDSLIVVNRDDDFIGVLPVTRLLVSSPTTTVREVMDTDTDVVYVDTRDTDVARLFERRDLVSAPVLNHDGKLVGRITIDDVVDVIREGADHSLMSMAGLDEEEDTFAPILKTTRRRALWLGINLLTAFIASAVIGLFDATIEKVVALAILMPIVASMGGIAGSQALTLVIRGMAIGQVRGANIRYLLNREFLVGSLNGILWATVVGITAVLWFNDIRIGYIIAAAMVINLMTAAVVGTALPLLLKARNIDPALAGGVLLTTITDVVGFMAFLGLATLVYG